MRIAIISSILNPHSGARAPIELARQLAKTNHVSLYASSRDSDMATLQTLRRERIKVNLLPYSSLPIVGIVAELVQLFKQLNYEKPDVISTHTTLSYFLITKLIRTPVVMTYYGTQFDALYEHFLRQVWWLTFLNELVNILTYIKVCLMVWSADEVIAISRYCQNEIFRLYKRRCQYIYLGGNPRFIRKQSRKKIAAQIRLLSVSRITPYKQFEKIISAVNLFPKKVEVRLTIAGSQPQAEYLNFLRSITDSRTRILTDVSDRELLELYRECDIYTTADRYLFFGLPIVEAAFFGKPTLACNYGAAGELIIHGKTGFIARTDEEFHRSFHILIHEKKVRTEMGKNARKFALRQFTWEKTANSYITFFGNVLKKNEKNQK